MSRCSSDIPPAPPTLTRTGRWPVRSSLARAAAMSPAAATSSTAGPMRPPPGRVSLAMASTLERTRAGRQRWLPGFPVGPAPAGMLAQGGGRGSGVADVTGGTLWTGFTEAGGWGVSPRGVGGGRPVRGVALRAEGGYELSGPGGCAGTEASSVPGRRRDPRGVVHRDLGRSGGSSAAGDGRREVISSWPTGSTTSPGRVRARSSRRASRRACPSAGSGCCMRSTAETCLTGPSS